MQKILFFILFISSLFISSCSQEKLETDSRKKRTVVVSQPSILPASGSYSLNCKKDLYFTGLNHNHVLQQLYNHSVGFEFNIQESFNLWAAIVNDELYLSGHQTLTDTEMEMLNEIMVGFYESALNSLDLIIAIEGLISNLPIDSYVKDRVMEVVYSSISDSEEGCDFLLALELLTYESLEYDELQFFQPFLWSAEYIYPASVYYWSNKARAEVEEGNEGEDTENDDSEREENLRELRCAVADVLGGFAATTTGVGAVLSGVVGAFVSFVWAEGVEPVLAEVRIE